MDTSGNMQHKRKRFILGDLHGGYKAFLQCLEKSGFNPKKDILYLLGDIVDGFPQSKECVDLILSFENYVFVRGNHCMWFMDYFRSNSNIIVADPVWLEHGGRATIESYKDGVPEEHKKFFEESVYWHITEDNKLLIHAGFSPGKPLDPRNYIYYLFNRNLVNKALTSTKSFHIPDYDEVFVGHTPTTRYIKEPKPITVGNLYMLDTGACFDGVLTIMDMDTKEYWSSDLVMTLYPDHKGRNEKSYNELLKSFNGKHTFTND